MFKIDFEYFDEAEYFIYQKIGAYSSIIGDVAMLVVLFLLTCFHIKWFFVKLIEHYTHIFCII